MTRTHQKKRNRGALTEPRKAVSIGFAGLGVGWLIFGLFRRFSAASGKLSVDRLERVVEESFYTGREDRLHPPPTAGIDYLTGYEDMAREDLPHINKLVFQVFPYLCLAVFAGGMTYRWFTSPCRWNAESTELLEKNGLKHASPLFHYAVLLSVAGHAGLLVPQKYFDSAGIDEKAHTIIDVVFGILFGFPALTANILLIRRRLAHRRLRLNSKPRHFATLLLLLSVVGIGTHNVLFDHYYVQETVAPWIRSILAFRPKPELMIIVPLNYKLHILSAFALLAYFPFSRLPHAFTAPLSYLPRSRLIFESRDERP